MRAPAPSRAQDELLLAWLVLSDAGFSVSLLASMAGLSRQYVHRCLDAVRRADADAHNPAYAERDFTLRLRRSQASPREVAI